MFTSRNGHVRWANYNMYTLYQTTDSVNRQPEGPFICKLK